MKRTRFFLLLLFLLPACTAQATESPAIAPSTTIDAISAPMPTETLTIEPSPAAEHGSVPTAIFLPTSTKSPPLPTATIAPIQPYPPGSPVNISYIHMTSQAEGWAIAGASGADQHLLYTLSGGNLWQDVTPPLPDQDQSQRLMGFYLDSPHAWITAYPLDQPSFSPSTVWFTGDAGKTWLQSQPLDFTGLEDTYFAPSYMYFIDSDHGWLALANDPGAGNAPLTIYQTTDGGQNWQMVHNPFEDDPSNLDVCCQTGMIFLDTQVGLVTADNGPITTPYVTWTRDGGRSWQSQDLPLPDLRFQEGMCGTRSPVAPDQQTVYLVMQCIRPQGTSGRSEPYLYLTRDAGQSWTNSPLPIPPSDATGAWRYNQRDYSIQVAQPGTIHLFVIDYYESGDGSKTQSLSHIYRSLNDGQTWEQVSTVYWGGQFTLVNDRDLWAVARNDQEVALVISQDGGINWSILKPVTRPN